MTTPVLFCNIGWMTNYRGKKGTGDAIENGGSYVTKHHTGNEVCNFLPAADGLVYGSVESRVGSAETGRETLIKIENLGASSQAPSVKGVTVVWTATPHGGGKRIVGWYRNAEVFRERQELTKQSPQHRKDKIQSFRIKARQVDAVLLPKQQRIIQMRVGTAGWPGHKQWWFAPGKKPSLELYSMLERVNALVLQTGNPISDDEAVHSGGWGSLAPDPERNKKVEEAAIDFVTKWYGHPKKCIVISVETKNYGWDLEATSHAGAKSTLLLEVKGRSGTDRQVGLSPNEYRVFKEHLAGAHPNYRLCIVSEALTDKPQLAVLRFDVDKARWNIENVKNGDIALDVSPIQSAIISIPRSKN